MRKVNDLQELKVLLEGRKERLNEIIASYDEDLDDYKIIKANGMLSAVCDILEVLG